jgi:hypothetical protein
MTIDAGEFSKSGSHLKRGVTGQKRSGPVYTGLDLEESVEEQCRNPYISHVTAGSADEVSENARFVTNDRTETRMGSEESRRASKHGLCRTNPGAVVRRDNGTGVRTPDA